MGPPSNHMAELIAIAKEIRTAVVHTDNAVRRIDMRTEQHSDHLSAVADIRSDITRMADAFEKLTNSAIAQINIRSRFDWKFAFFTMVMLGIIAALLILSYTGRGFSFNRNGITVEGPAK